MSRINIPTNQHNATNASASSVRCRELETRTRTRTGSVTRDTDGALVPLPTALQVACFKQHKAAQKEKMSFLRRNFGRVSRVLVWGEAPHTHPRS